VGAPRAEFEDLNRRGHKAAEVGHLDKALELFDEMLVWARRHEANELIDLALCNRAAIAIVLGRGEQDLLPLRNILVRSEDAGHCHLAAYNLARYYEIAKAHKKALFYARVASEYAEQKGRSDWIASSYNLIGNVLLADNSVEEATRQYEKALEAMPAEPSVWRARIQDNLGFCRILQGRYTEGYSLLYRSLAVLRRHGAERYLISTRSDLCFAHIENRRFHDALRHGMAALGLAEKIGQPEGIKQALYLLGETAKLSGDMDSARGYFARLQREFFPGETYVTNILLALNVRRFTRFTARDIRLVRIFKSLREDDKRELEEFIASKRMHGTLQGTDRVPVGRRTLVPKELEG